MFLKHNNHNGKAKKLPKTVRDYMRWKFGLLPEYLEMLRCFDYTSLLNGEQVMHVNIFSPYRAQEHHLSIKTNLELEQHPEMLLFKGYINQHGSVFIAGCYKLAV